MRQHLLRLGILIVGGCVGMVTGAYRTHEAESSKIAALQNEIGQLKRDAEAQLDTSVGLDTFAGAVGQKMQSEYERERLRRMILDDKRGREEMFEAKWGEQAAKAIIEADKAESGKLSP